MHSSFLPLRIPQEKFYGCQYSYNPSILLCYILGYTEYWELEDFQLRPIKIIGYIDGILNNCKLSGIGTLNFEGCKELLVNSSFSGYTLTYRAIHGSDDKIPVKE